MKSILLSFLVFGLLSCGKILQPDFKGIENIHTDKFGLQQTDLSLDILYYNPNKYGVKLKSAEGDAWVDTQFLGHFIVDTTIQIPAKADFRLPVKLSVDTRNVFRNSLTAFLHNEVTVKISGTARLGKAGIFFNYPLDYQVKQPLSDFIK